MNPITQSFPFCNPISTFIPYHHVSFHLPRQSSINTNHLTRLSKPPPKSMHTPNNPTNKPNIINIRHDAIDPPPAFLPQTVEYAIRCAQAATRSALILGQTRLSVELPMGRSRRHWYRMSPMDLWYSETETLALHFVELFSPLEVHIVFCGRNKRTEKRTEKGKNDKPFAQPPPDYCTIHRLQDVHHTIDLRHRRKQDKKEDDENGRVLMIAAANENQHAEIERIIKLGEKWEAIILLNCFMDCVNARLPKDFLRAYTCRAIDKAAVLQEGVNKRWEIFVEIAVFEYEWVGEEKGKEIPSQNQVERLALLRGARKKGINGYWESSFGGCEAGFWPFMTAACRHVMPLDGGMWEKERRRKVEKKSKGSSKPFGFF